MELRDGVFLKSLSQFPGNGKRNSALDFLGDTARSGFVQGKAFSGRNLSLFPYLLWGFFQALSVFFLHKNLAMFAIVTVIICLLISFIR